MNRSQFLADKKIRNYLDSLPEKLRSTRVVMGWLKKTTGQAHDEEMTKNNTGEVIKAGMKSFLPTNSMFWKKGFGILVCSKSFEENQPDEELLDSDQLPDWMDVDTFYYFDYQKQGDDKSFKSKILGNQILMVEPISDPKLKGKYNFTLEIKEKIYVFGTEFALETNEWVKALKTAKKTYEDMSRTKNEGLFRNIDLLISLYKNKKTQELEKNINYDFERFESRIDIDSSPIQEFITSVHNQQQFYINTLDAIQAHRPFYQELFSIYIKKIHMKFTRLIAQFWNTRREDFGVILLLIIGT